MRVSVSGFQTLQQFPVTPQMALVSCPHILGETTTPMAASYNPSSLGHETYLLLEPPFASIPVKLIISPLPPLLELTPCLTEPSWTDVLGDQKFVVDRLHSIAARFSARFVGCRGVRHDARGP